MKTLFLIISFCVTVMPYAQVHAAEQTTAFSVFAAEESVLNGAAVARMKVIQDVTGIVFDKGTHPKVRIENMYYRDNNGAMKSRIAEYDPADQRIMISTKLWGEIENALRKPLRFASVKDLLRVEDFIFILDHELGHLLSDQVSKRNGFGPWYDGKAFDSMAEDPDRLRGFRAISEGFSEWIAHSLHPSKEANGYCEKCYPENCAREYDKFEVWYHGGYWIVKDILRKHRVRGLIWMIQNPLNLGEVNMRADAIEYRKLALKELANKRRKNRRR